MYNGQEQTGKEHAFQMIEIQAELERLSGMMKDAEYMC